MPDIFMPTKKHMETLPIDALCVVLNGTPAWVSRSVCRMFRRHCASRSSCAASAVSSIAQCRLAMQSGLPQAYAWRAAASAGNTDVLDWALSRYTIDAGDRYEPVDLATAHVCAAAARNGHLYTVQWAWTHGLGWNAWAGYCAARGGHLDLLKWVRYDTWDIWYRGGDGAVDPTDEYSRVLAWAQSHGCERHGIACYGAALGGHTAVLEWLMPDVYDEDMDAYTFVCSGTAEGGHLSALQWARARGHHWDTRTCRMAAAHGHMSVLMWAVANGCQLDRDECLACASLAGHGLIVEYLTEMGR
jgi:hypothetical protein